MASLGGPATALGARPAPLACLALLVTILLAGWAGAVPPSPGVRGHIDFGAGCKRAPCPWMNETSPMLVDTDIGLGQWLTDVDDAVALHYLVTAGVEVTGLTTVFGNAALQRTHTVALMLGGGWRIPVWQGGGRAEEGGWDAVKQLNNHEGGVLAIGPLTNLAFALQRNPSWERLVVLGGSLPHGPNVRYLRTTELNFALDEWAAAEVLLRAPAVVGGGEDPDRRPVLVPMDACREGGVHFAEDEIALLPPWLGEQCRGWLRAVRWLTWSTGFIPWDVVAAMVLTHPQLFTLRRGGVRLLPGRTRWQRGYVEYDWSGEGWDVVVGVDGPALLRAYRDLYAPAGPDKAEGVPKRKKGGPKRGPTKRRDGEL